MYNYFVWQWSGQYGPLARAFNSFTSDWMSVGYTSAKVLRLPHLYNYFRGLPQPSDAALTEMCWGIAGAFPEVFPPFDPNMLNSSVAQPVAATDPNQKLGPGGSGDAGYVSHRDILPYRIDFENEEDATAPAHRVVITDQLDENLNWDSFELMEIGFGDEFIAVPADSRHHFETVVPVTHSNVSFEVHIEAGIRLGQGEVYAVFQSIDPDTGLPPPVEIGFLPPEDGTGRGQGHIAYVVRSDPGLPHGTEIRNVALISFDLAPAISTDQVDPHDASKGIDTNKQALVTIDAIGPSSEIDELPAFSPAAIDLSWGGSDVGAGVSRYDVYVSKDLGPYQPWLRGTKATHRVYRGEVDAIYYFYSVATDGAGNREEPPNRPDALTYVYAVEPVIAAIGVSNATVRLTFGDLTPGWSTTVERSHDVTSNIWERVEGFVPTGQSMDVDVPMSTNRPRAFYRLRGVEPE